MSWYFIRIYFILETKVQLTRVKIGRDILKFCWQRNAQANISVEQMAYTPRHFLYGTVLYAWVQKRKKEMTAITHVCSKRTGCTKIDTLGFVACRRASAFLVFDSWSHTPNLAFFFFILFLLTLYTSGMLTRAFSHCRKETICTSNLHSTRAEFLRKKKK